MGFMRSPVRPVSDQTPSPFAGCNRLLEQYRQTGAALIRYERNLFGTLVPGQRQLKDLSVAVSFVPVEVLESYLDDLLDLGVSDESLFIKRPQPSVKALTIGILGAITLVVGLATELPDTSTAWGFPLLLVLMFCAGLASAFYFLPRTKIVRRFGFATAVSRVIASRRGHDKTDIGNYTTQFIIRGLWAKPEAPGATSLTAYPARVSTPRRRYYH